MAKAPESIAFDTTRREAVADRFGMWIFLGSEAMLFGSLLLVYQLSRQHFAVTFAEAAKHLSLPLGTLNTAVLLTSSFTMALAHRDITAGRQKPAIRMLGLTALLGIAFLGIKATEYVKEFHEGLAPVLGLPFEYPGPDGAHAQLFFRQYFALTSLHALHMIAGIGVIAVMLVFWQRTDANARVHRTHAIGLYWHFVDIVWIFIFPSLYLAHG